MMTYHGDAAVKECKRCSIEKAATEFYANDRTCKECRKALVRANRAAKIEHYRAYDRQRGSRPDRVKAREEYQATEQGREATSRAKRRYSERNRRKREAHVALGNAVRGGKLWKSPCCMAPDCFSADRIHGHHADYSAPLSVVWLCHSCHAQLHKEHRARVRREVVHG